MYKNNNGLIAKMKVNDYKKRSVYNRKLVHFNPLLFVCETVSNTKYTSDKSSFNKSIMKNIVIILFALISNQVFSQSITLSPNTSFFSPRGTLKLFGLTSVTDEFNGNKHYERIGNWRVVSDTIVWGLKDMQIGTVNIELFAGISADENNAEISIFLDNQQQDLIVSSTATLQDFQSQGSVSFSVDEPGTHEVKIKIKTQNSTNDFGEIEKLVLTGTAINEASVWQRRWRPAAIHGSFISQNDVNTEITVYEVTVLSHELDSYQVMTTEFGYIGAPNERNSQGLNGLNFSLWSYDADEPEPPHNELSHLIAVGGAGNGFGRYGHEGTGVKPRGFDPFDNSPVYTFTIASRKQPGTIYNTYWCYYFDTVSSEWKLYASGKKLNESGGLNYLNTSGGFLEAVGPPDIARTGHRTRSVEYRGWRMQNDNSWNVIDELNPAYNSATSLSYKEWTQNSTGDKFIFKIGGFLDSGPDPGIIQLSNPSALPFYLQGNYIDQLYEAPANFNTLSPSMISSDEVELKFNIQNLGTNPEIQIFYGTEYGLTEGIHENYVIDTVWQEQQDVPLSSISNGVLSVPLTNLIPNTEYFYRLRVKNDEGITWLFDTESFVTEAILSNEDIVQTENQLSIYPNPTSSQLNIEYDQLDSTEAKIYNSNGQFISSRIVENNRIHINDLTAGIYFIKLKFYEGFKIVKVIKQ